MSDERAKTDSAQDAADSRQVLALVPRLNPDHGFEAAALALARRLFAQYDEEIDALTLIPVPDDDFSLYLNGVLLCSQEVSGRAPLVADVKAALRAGPG